MSKDFLQVEKAVTIKVKVGRLRMENNPFQYPQNLQKVPLETQNYHLQSCSPINVAQHGA